MRPTNACVRVALGMWTVVTLILVIGSVATGARAASSALLFILFAAPLCVAHALGADAMSPPVGEMLHAVSPRGRR
jgi:succinate-acetate transporter protein